MAAGRHLQRGAGQNYLVEVGGELKAGGHRPDGTLWEVGIERPDAATGSVVAADELVRTVELRDQAIATSGDYRHLFEDQGHISIRTTSIHVPASRCRMRWHR